MSSLRSKGEQSGLQVTADLSPLGPQKDILSLYVLVHKSYKLWR